MTNHERSHKMYAMLTYAFLALGFIALAVWVYWSFYPYKTITQSPKPFEIVYPGHSDGELPRVSQGGLLAYQFEYIKYTNVLPTLQREFHDGLIFSEGARPPTVLRRGAGLARTEVMIPRTLPPGTYRIVITARYEMNPVRVIEVVNHTEKFIVEEVTK